MRQSLNDATLLRIVIPAHNEALRIEGTIHEYCAVFSDIGIVTVVCNGCTDDTFAVVSSLIPQYSNFVLMNIPAPIGKGGAVRAGLTVGDEPYVGYVDADGSTAAMEFKRLFGILDLTKVDGVIASRWLRESVLRPPQPLKRRVTSRAFNLVARLLMGLPFSDTQCGAKIFKREAVAKVLRDLEISDFAFDIDLLSKLRVAGQTLREIPTEWSDVVEGSKINVVRSSATMLAALLRLRLRRSPLKVLPFLDGFAGDSVIPVRKPARVLLLARERTVPEAAFALECEKRLIAAGNEVVRPRSVAANVMSTVGWYALRGHRTCDAIMEVASEQPFYFPRYSRKRVFVLHRGEADRIRYQSLYPNSTTLCEGTLSELLQEVRPYEMHRASFVFNEGTWTIRYLESSAEVVELPLSS